MNSSRIYRLRGWRTRYAQRHLAALIALLSITCTPSTPHPQGAEHAALAVAAYGDSLTTGWVLPGWPSALPENWVRFNGGIDAEHGVPKRNLDGSLMMTGALRPTSDPDFTTLFADWDVVVMMWGSNDVLYEGYSDELSQPSPEWNAAWPYQTITDEDLMGSIEGAAMTLQAAGIQVIVAWPPPTLPGQVNGALGNARLARMRGPMRARIEAHGIRFVDFFGEFSVSSSVPDPTIYYLDTVHWNELGNARAAARITEAILADCLPGFTGPICATAIDECEANPCQEGEVCIDGIASFTCTNQP